MATPRDHESDPVRRAIAGDPAAREALWRTHRRAVAAVLLAQRGRMRPSEVEDLLQEVALRFCRSVSTLREPERFEPWLMQVARNAAREAGRRARVRDGMQPLEQADEVATRGDRDAGALERDELLARVLALPEELREPLLLRCVEQLPQRRVAELLGITEAAVEARLVRGRRLLRERLGRSGTNGADPAAGARATERTMRERRT